MVNRKTKNWKGYFLEFLLLFLAVSLGFMADNFREKASERTKEKEYIQSMIEDVGEDKINIEEVINVNGNRIKNLDSLLNICFHYKPVDKIKFNRYFVHIITHPEFIAPTELTMQQLKNAGGMRLIKSKKAINAIIRYDTQLKKIANQQKYYEAYQNKAIDLGTKIFNLQKLVFALRNPNNKRTSKDFELITDDEVMLKELGNSVAMYKGIMEYYVILLQEMEEQGEVLTETLKKAYDLQ